MTDSAAAATGWGSGSRVFNGSINSLPDGTLMTPLARIVRGAGKRVGLVTTATVTHATPAGFAATQTKRDDEQEIAPQYRDLVDIVMGGGAKFFPPELIEQYKSSGYSIVRHQDELAAAAGSEKLLGLFADSHVPFTIDQRADPILTERVPSLSAMTQWALNSLERAPGGFVLQVEGARVDHAAHANDVPALFHDQLAFDASIQIVMEFARRRGDTLVIITTDHGNSNPGLLGMGTNYNDSGTLLARVGPMRSSYAATLSLIRKESGDQPIAAATVADVVQDRLQARLARAQSQAIAEVLNRTRHPTPLNPQLHNVVGTFGQVMVNHSGIAWLGTTHTSDLTLISAFGPGSERFGGVVLNPEAFTIVTELLDCPFQNPSMTPDQARRFARASTGAEDFGWLQELIA